MNEFGFERIGEFDPICSQHFGYLTSEAYGRYFDSVKTGQIYCFAIYKDGERAGTTLAEIVIKEGEKIMICLETGGEGVKVEHEYLGMYLAICKVEQCSKFVIGTSRKGMMKLAEKSGMRLAYSEYEIEVGNEQ